MNYVIFTTLKESKGIASRIQKISLDNWAGVFLGGDFVEFNGPLIPFSKMVEQVEQDSNADILIYSNADILFDKERVWHLWRILQNNWPKQLSGNFLLTGQRVDILEDGARRLHRPSGMDYFMFRRGMFRDLPHTLMGRAHCDSALVAYCERRDIPVIDASFALKVEHQFHDYGHVKGGKTEVWCGEQALENMRENGLRPFGPHCVDASHTLLPDGRIVSNIRMSFLRRLEIELYYRRGYKWCPQFNKLWNILTRGGKWWKNPRWDGVGDI